MWDQLLKLLNTYMAEMTNAALSYPVYIVVKSESVAQSVIEVTEEETTSEGLPKHLSEQNEVS